MEEYGLEFPSEIGTPLDERSVLRRYQNICQVNGLPKLRHYDLRYSHASLLINEGVHAKKIAERFGHAPIRLTIHTYGHLFEGSDRDSAEKMEQRFGAGPKKAPVLTIHQQKNLGTKVPVRPEAGFRTQRNQGSERIGRMLPTKRCLSKEVPGTCQCKRRTLED